jgi:hypothetical protein
MVYEEVWCVVGVLQVYRNGEEMCGLFLLKYCASRSRDELSEETWDDFVESIRNRELLSYLGS